MSEETERVCCDCGQPLSEDEAYACDDCAAFYEITDPNSAMTGERDG